MNYNSLFDPIRGGFISNTDPGNVYRELNVRAMFEQMSKL